MELREEFVKNITNDLLVEFSPEQVETIINTVYINLYQYDLVEKCTGLVPIEKSCETLLELYAGALLTNGKSKNTVNTYIKFLRRFRNEVGIRFLDISSLDVRIWLAKKSKETSFRTCENYRAYLSSFYIFLEKEEYIEKNPMKKIYRIHYLEEIKKAFSNVEIDKIRMNCKNIRNRAIFEMLLSTGLRISELCDLEISDIDFMTKSVHVRNGKGKKQRKVYMTDLCVTYLNNYLETRTDTLEALFVTKNKTKLTPQVVRLAFKNLEKECGVKNIHPHRCRRTFATKLSKNGMPVQVIKKLMGHSDINITLKYIALNDDVTSIEYMKCSQ